MEDDFVSRRGSGAEAERLETLEFGMAGVRAKPLDCLSMRGGMPGLTAADRSRRGDICARFSRRPMSGHPELPPTRSRLVNRKSLSALGRAGPTCPNGADRRRKPRKPQLHMVRILASESLHADPQRHLLARGICAGASPSLSDTGHAELRFEKNPQHAMLCWPVH
jgi:hypothetical protein